MTALMTEFRDACGAVIGHLHARYELLSRVVFRGPGSGGVLQDSVGEDSSFENKNDLVMRVESSPTSAG